MWVVRYAAVVMRLRYQLVVQQLTLGRWHWRADLLGHRHRGAALTPQSGDFSPPSERNGGVVKSGRFRHPKRNQASARHPAVAPEATLLSTGGRQKDQERDEEGPRDGLSGNACRTNIWGLRMRAPVRASTQQLLSDLRLGSSALKSDAEGFDSPIGDFPEVVSYRSQLLRSCCGSGASMPSSQTSRSRVDL